jgi:hypothetical protein
MVVDIEVCHTQVVVGCKGCGVLWYQSTHLQRDTFQFFRGQMIRVWVHHVTVGAIICIIYYQT